MIFVGVVLLIRFVGAQLLCPANFLAPSPRSSGAWQS